MDGPTVELGEYLLQNLALPSSVPADRNTRWDRQQRDRRSRRGDGDADGSDLAFDNHVKVFDGGYVGARPCRV